MSVIFPRAFAIVVDDLGWNDGGDLTLTPGGGPYRCGFDRTFTVDDYQALVDVAKSVGVRLQCAFILGEMDRENILGRFPTTTYLREKWDNTYRVCDEQIQIMNFVKQQAAHMEFGLHGIGHEYWAPGEIQKRAEWYNLHDKQPWPEQSLQEHIDCFKAIMAQYGFTKENGHSFPKSFVPCAYSYYWNPKGDYSLGKLLHNAGIKYANTDFSMIAELNPPNDTNGGGFDHGVHVINRINYGNLWDAVATLPSAKIDEQKTDVIESHWPNWLSELREDQQSVNQQWIDYYRHVQQTEDRYVARNTEQLHSQWLYNRYAVVTEPEEGHVEIDNTRMPPEVYQNELPGNLVLKVKLMGENHISAIQLDGKPVMTHFEEAGFGFIYLPPLERRKYNLRYTIGEHMPTRHILVDGTFNIYNVDERETNLNIRLCTYGSQDLKVKCGRPTAVHSSNKQLSITHQEYNSMTGYLSLRMVATDMQGDTGDITIEF